MAGFSTDGRRERGLRRWRMISLGSDGGLVVKGSGNRGMRFGWQLNFNTSEIGEIEKIWRIQPPHLAGKTSQFCNMGRFAMQYGLYCIARQAILEGETTLFAMQKRLFLGWKWPLRELKKLHTRTNNTSKSYKSNELRLHTRDWRICGRGQFVFQIREISGE